MEKTINLDKCNIYYVRVMIKKKGSVEERDIILTAKEYKDIKAKLHKWTKAVYGFSRNVIDRWEVYKTIECGEEQVSLSKETKKKKKNSSR